MLMIRLARRGKKNRPFFRVVVSEKHKDMFGTAVEIVGHLDPFKEPREVVLNKERVQYWLSKGAQTSPTVHNILVDEKVITSAKIIKKNAKKADDSKK